jgi:hypothetical protein
MTGCMEGVVGLVLTYFKKHQYVATNDDTKRNQNKDEHAERGVGNVGQKFWKNNETRRTTSYELKTTYLKH